MDTATVRAMPDSATLFKQLGQESNVRFQSTGLESGAPPPSIQMSTACPHIARLEYLMFFYHLHGFIATTGIKHGKRIVDPPTSATEYAAPIWRLNIAARGKNLLRSLSPSHVAVCVVHVVVQDVLRKSKDPLPMKSTHLTVDIHWTIAFYLRLEKKSGTMINNS